MALTIHAPHLPHLEDWARHRTMLIGIAAVSITAGTVYVVQQQTNDAAPAATVSVPAIASSTDTGEFLGLDDVPAAAAVSAPAAGSLDTGEFLGFDTAPAAAAVADTGEFLGLDTAPANTSSAAVDTGEFLGLDTAPAAAAAVGSVEFRSGHVLP